MRPKRTKIKSCEEAVALAHCRALTDKADVFREGARSQLRLVAAGRAIEQEDQGQVRPSPVDLLQNASGVSRRLCKRK